MASSLASPSAIAFCQRCGDPISSKFNCSKCGGRPSIPKVRSSAPPTSTHKPDPWATRYVSGSPSSAPSSSDYLLSVASRNKVQNPPRASTDHSFGLGMPSRITDDLRSSSLANNSFRSSQSVNPTSKGDTRSAHDSQSSAISASPNHDDIGDLSIASQDYSAPTLVTADGVLSKVCGSLVEPSSSRNKWACHGCSTIFARDATIYAAPDSVTSGSAELKQGGAYFCKPCYSERFSLGSCVSCRKDVLGSTKEDGKYVKATLGIWHGKCWRCTGCDRGGGRDGVEILVGMDGNPSCEDCFGKPPGYRKDKEQQALAAKMSPSSSRSSAIDRSQDYNARNVNRLSAASRSGMGATIAELSKRFDKGSSTSSQAPSSSALSPSLTGTRSGQTWSSIDAINRSPSRTSFTLSPTLQRSHSRNNSLNRAPSITGSPPKPRPLTAHFTDGLNLAAFRPSSAAGADGSAPFLTRSDSRSRSVSPVKRIPVDGPLLPSCSTGSSGRQNATAALLEFGGKVPGSPDKRNDFGASTLSGNSVRIPQNGDPSRERTASGYPRPLNAHFSKSSESSEPRQGDKNSELNTELDRAPSSSSPRSEEEGSGDVVCAICLKSPFEAPSIRSGREVDEVVMVTLQGGKQLHAECFKCDICHGRIDAGKSFVRLSEDPIVDRVSSNGLSRIGRFCHPSCAPPVKLVTTTTRTGEDKGTKYLSASIAFGGGGRGSGACSPSSGDEDRYEKHHATHQRAPKPSPTPSPNASMRQAYTKPRSSVLPSPSPTSDGKVGEPTKGKGREEEEKENSRGVKRFVPSAGGAAPPTRSTLLTTRSETKGHPNPAAGIFSRSGGVGGIGNSKDQIGSLGGGGVGGLKENATIGGGQAITTGGIGGRRLGGMQTCFFCSESLSQLESVLGPRSTHWHRKCLICRGHPAVDHHQAKVRPSWNGGGSTSICGKKLDSAAKVTEDGQVRCRDCFDREFSMFGRKR
ncbi:hypothetical protein IE53DRAFT_382044 [Violaceomyces palustris]|uniref:Uncharacterized protein n=1 Tax=Violaceomyces palustris TaxID=1673888 RepID=A0ACD0NNZ6_9BASI|nr:hypothetical protein IE53DRAFT_382044 [Violaceomyces palustris]